VTNRTIKQALPYIGAAFVYITYFTVKNQNINASIMRDPMRVVPYVLTAILIYYTIRAIYLKIKHSEKYEKHVENAPKRFAVLIAVGLWDIFVKIGILPSPYFQTLDKILNVYVDEYVTLIISVLYSLRLLFLGYFCGMATGIVTGVFVGWYKKVSYWIMPVVKAIGPIPVTVWIPIIVVLVPTMFAGSVVLIAIGVWFPAALMTASGIWAAPQSYFEVARTMGADERYLILHVAIPAALPNMFLGSFMGMSISCVTLISAEMLGVKAGLGWFINAASGWAKFDSVYAGILIILLVFTTIVTLLFKIQSRLLAWQKNKIEW
jgi:NitT/TauT family transport system permease protein